MALKHAASGEVVNLLSAAESPDFISQAIVSAPRIEVMRLVLQAGKVIPGHAVAGPLTLHCLQGCVDVQAQGRWHEMRDNDLMYLAEEAEHALQAKTDSIMLVTLFRPSHASFST